MGYFRPFLTRTDYIQKSFKSLLLKRQKKTLNVKNKSAKAKKNTGWGASNAPSPFSFKIGFPIKYLQTLLNQFYK